MNVSVLGVLVVCGLAAFTSAAAVLAYATAARDARSRRRRGRLRLVVGGGGAARRPADGTVRAAARASRDDGDAVVSWDPLPVTQWQPPRERAPRSSSAGSTTPASTPRR